MAFQLENIQKQKAAQSSEKEISFLKKEIVVFKKPFSNKVKEDFYTELSVLLNAGVNLKDALELLHTSIKKEQHKAVVNALINDVVAGKSFSEAMEVQNPFTNYEYFSVKIGEETGTLAEITKQLGAFFARKNEQRRHLISALTYPIIILSTAVLVVVFMLRYVVPMFEDIFKQQGVELPGITKFIIKLSGLMHSYGWLLLILFIAIPFIRVTMKNNMVYKQWKDKIMGRLPFIGQFLKTVYLSQFTQAVALLTASKVPIVHSIQLVKQMINYHPLQWALDKVEHQLLLGSPLSTALKEHKLFDAKMVALVKVAEETNQTEFMFQRLNDQYNDQVQRRSKLLSTVMEPIIILFVGIFVGIILIAMYLPMFKLSSVLG